MIINGVEYEDFTILGYGRWMVKKGIPSPTSEDGERWHTEYQRDYPKFQAEYDSKVAEYLKIPGNEFTSFIDPNFREWTRKLRNQLLEKYPGARKQEWEHLYDHFKDNLVSIDDVIPNFVKHFNKNEGMNDPS